ncbi:TrmH family RNA methyltransferase [Actinokineospora sp. 24-640]
MSTQQRPGAYTERTPRVAAARHLTRRAGRDKAGRFLAEGAQAVREAVTHGRVHEIFATAWAAEREPDLISAAEAAGIRVSEVTDKAAAGLSETVTPQGLVAVCDLLDRPLESVVSGTMVAVLVGVADPGNAGTVTRAADAAGADAVVFAGDTVDPHNGKCVRASTGSVFHLPIARTREVGAALAACRAAGLRLIAADGHAEHDLHGTDGASADLTGPTAWVFGNEAHGLPPEVIAACDTALRIPLYGPAESLNLATAAALCLYETARAQRRPTR